jgi:hypothetical protein
MKKIVLVLSLLIVTAGCYKEYDPDVNLPPGVRSDSVGNNIITRPITGLISILIGEGIVVNNIKEARTPEGFLEVQVSGVNKSQYKKIFEYRPEWLDANGMLIDTVMSKWQTMSVMPESGFQFKVTAPTADANDYRINTRKARNMDK